MKLDASNIISQFWDKKYADFYIKYHKYVDKNWVVDWKWEVDIYFEWKVSYSWWRENMKFDTLKELQEFLNSYELQFNL